MPLWAHPDTLGEPDAQPDCNSPEQDAYQHEAGRVIDLPDYKSSAPTATRTRTTRGCNTVPIGLNSRSHAVAHGDALQTLGESQFLGSKSLGRGAVRCLFGHLRPVQHDALDSFHHIAQPGLDIAESMGCLSELTFWTFDLRGDLFELATVAHLS